MYEISWLTRSDSNQKKGWFAYIAVTIYTFIVLSDCQGSPYQKVQLGKALIEMLEIRGLNIFDFYCLENTIIDKIWFSLH